MALENKHLDSTYIMLLHRANTPELQTHWTHGLRVKSEILSKNN